MMDMNITTGISWAFFIFALPVLGGLVAAIVLLAFRKTRVAGGVLLGLIVLSMLSIMGFRFSSSRSVASRFQRSATEDDVNTYPTKIQAEYRKYPRADLSSANEAGKAEAMASRKAASSKPDAYNKAAEKAEAEPAVDVASQAAGMIDAISLAMKQALRGMLTETKKPAVAKKPEAKPAPAPPSPPAKTPPAWVNAPPRVVGDSYEMSIVVGPWKTRQECNAELPGELQRALDEYVQTCEPAGNRIGLPTDYLQQHLVKQEWEEDIQSKSVGPMKRLHVLLRFDHEVKNRIVEAIHRGIVTGRLLSVGIGLAGVFWLLAVVYGYLRIDLATGGIYRGRLRFAAALAILGLVAAALATLT
jgi:hypothetical protein